MGLLLDILSTAAMLFIVTAGLMIIFGVMKIVNFAHGAIITLGSYASLVVTQLGLNPWLALPFALAVGAAVGAGVERLIVRPLYKRPLDAILATWGLGIVIGQLITMAFGREVQFADAPVKGAVAFLGTDYSAYRLLLIVPYAIPGFISLLVWSSFFNKDFGLINHLTGISLDWFGHVWSARLAVLLTNLWMGFPYMFLVCTGALQSIPEDLKEAAALDGAGRWTTFRRITLPSLRRTLLLVVMLQTAAQLQLFGQAQLLTAGGPSGASRTMVLFIYEVAFGRWELGYATAAAELLFMLVLGITLLQYWLVTRQETDQ